MVEKAFEVDMIYIQNTEGDKYRVEILSRKANNIVLNFSGIEGIEFNAVKPAEIKTSFVQFGAGEKNIWNIRFNFPVNISISALSNIKIEVI